MKIMKRGRFLPLFIILFAFIFPSTAPISDSVNAASTCSLTGQTTPDWGEDAELIETGSNKNFEEDIFFGQEGFSVGIGRALTTMKMKLLLAWVTVVNLRMELSLNFRPAKVVMPVELD